MTALNGEEAFWSPWTKLYRVLFWVGVLIGAALVLHILLLVIFMYPHTHPRGAAAVSFRVSNSTSCCSRCPPSRTEPQVCVSVRVWALSTRSSLSHRRQ